MTPQICQTFFLHYMISCQSFVHSRMIKLFFVVFVKVEAKLSPWVGNVVAYNYMKNFWYNYWILHSQVELSLQRGHIQQFSYIHATNMIRPQLKWADKIDNSSAPFRPIIKHKPNALRPLPTGDAKSINCM